MPISRSCRPRQYLDLSAYDDAIWVVGENEFSLLDFAAGNVRIVDPDELTEIDLANEPDGPARASIGERGRHSRSIRSRPRNPLPTRARTTTASSIAS